MSDVLRSFWREPSVPHPPIRVWRDWVIVGLMVPLVLIEVVVRPDMPLRWISLCTGLLVAPTFLWRRTHPLPMVAIAFGAFIGVDLYRAVVGGAPQELYSSAFVLVLPYALFRWASGRHAAIGLGIMMIPALTAAVFDYTGLADAIGGFGLFFFVIAAGAAIRFRERARTREIEQAKLREREHLARDLHDTVAHHVSAIAIRAQAGIAVAPTRPDAALDALRVIEAEASRTLAEMRTMVRHLRHDEPADLAPNPMIPDIERLAKADTTGPRVVVEISGDSEQVSPPVSTAIYRIAQESVTNARRHARHATRIVVGVRTDHSSVRLSVRDDGESGHARPAPGYGLIGMYERAALLGGTCVAGPSPDRGWTVTAVLPRNGAAS